VLDVAERQVNTRFGYSRFLGNFMFGVPLRWPGHDKQTSGRQSFREHNRAILRFQTKQAGSPTLTIFACTIPTEGAPSLRLLQEPALSLSKGWAAMVRVLFDFVVDT
jgi:hypothetical protein